METPELPNLIPPPPAPPANTPSYVQPPAPQFPPYSPSIYATPTARSGGRLSVIRWLSAFVALIVVVASVVALAGAHRIVATRSPVSPGSSTPNSSTNTGSSGTTNLTPQSIADATDPAVADVTNNLADGSGTAAGTGIVLTSTGEIVTNNHVVAGAGSITVQLDGTGTVYTANVVGVDVPDDVAVIQLVDASDLPTVKIGDSSTVAPGDAVEALGNALGKGGTPAATTGSIVATDQEITASLDNGNSEALIGLIEMDATIQPGDSGGPLVNDRGEVIGMDVAGSTSGRRLESTVGYSIPINTVVADAKTIESGTTGNGVQGAHTAYLGVDVEDDPGTTGAPVAHIIPNTPAAQAGLVVGDVITAVGSTPIDTSSALGTALHIHKPGDSVTITYVDASGAQHNLSIVLASGPPA